MFGLDRYQYYTNASGFDYEFDSVGPAGTIRKVAHFSVMGTNVYNFGFGDLDINTGEISDTVKSKNGDSNRILGTLGSIIYDFTTMYMEALIYIEGTDATRTRFYQMNISKYWNQIEPIFEVFGLLNGQWEDFRKGINYEAFMGRRKTSFLF